MSSNWRNNNVRINVNMNPGNMNDFYTQFNNMMNNYNNFFNNWMNSLNSNQGNRMIQGNQGNNRVFNFNFNNLMDSLNNVNGPNTFNFHYEFNSNSNNNDDLNASASSNSGNFIRDSINNSASFNNLSGFEKKKLELILEMDEFQYKHIQKYEDSRKETECAICLSDFKGTDIIKAFYKCNHIYHKKCLLNWLKDHDFCPLCKHNLKDDIH